MSYVPKVKDNQTVPSTTTTTATTTPATTATTPVQNGDKKVKPPAKEKKPHPKKQYAEKKPAAVVKDNQPTTTTTTTASGGSSGVQAITPSVPTTPTIKESPKHHREPRPKKAIATTAIPPNPTLTSSDSNNNTTTTTTTTSSPTPPKAKKTFKEKKLQKQQQQQQQAQDQLNTTTTTTTTTQPQQVKQSPKNNNQRNKLNSDLAEKKKQQQEKERHDKQEKDRLEKERLEKERLERQEKERIEKEKLAEQERLLELERIEKEKQKKELEEKQERERIQKLKEELLGFKKLRDTNLQFNKSKNLPKDLDSNFKRVSAFVKKVKNLGEENRENILQDVKQLSLSQYKSEIIPSILKSNFKYSDINYIVQIFSILYQRYEEIDTLVHEHIYPLFLPIILPSSDSESEKNSKITKRRLIIRLVMDLFYVDVLHTFSPIQKLVTKLTTVSIDIDKESGYPNLLIVLNFLKPFTQFISLNKKDKNSELPDIYSGLLTPEESKVIMTLITNYYNGLCDFLTKEQNLLKEKEKEIKVLMMTKGEVPTDVNTLYENMRKQYDKLITNISGIAELIGEPVPNNDYSKMESEEKDQKIDQFEQFESPYESEEQKQFYETFVDIKTLLGNSITSSTTPTISSSNSEATATTTTTSSTPSTPTSNREEMKKEKSKNKQLLEDLLKQLKSACKVSQVDPIVIEFLKLPIKYTKKFLQQIYNPSRNDQIPYFARFMANIYQSPVYRDYVLSFIKEMEEDLKQLLLRKESNLLGVKLKEIIFFSELIKFRVLSRSVAFSYLKLCFDDFSHHNIDVACALFENVGRYLYRSPDTQVRTRNMLDILVKYKNAKLMDPLKEIMIDNAYLTCRPVQSLKKKESNPLKLFTKHLIFKNLNKSTIKPVVQKLLQLPWPDCKEYLCKYLLDVQKGKFGNIYLIADVIYHLNSYHPQFVRYLILRLYEEITVGFEKNNFNFNQKRIMQVTLFGELFNACVLHPVHVFSLLNATLEYGYSSIHLFPANPEREKEILQHRPKPNLEDFDPQNDCFRIRYVCSLILVCKECFSDEDISELKTYLIFLQRYSLTKQLPLEIDFMISDCLQLAPGIKVYKDWNEANEDCQKILNQQQKSKEKLPQLPQQQQPQQQQQQIQQQNDDHQDSESSSHRRQKQVKPTNHQLNIPISVIDTLSSKDSYFSKQQNKKIIDEDKLEEDEMMKEFKQLLSDTSYESSPNTSGISSSSNGSTPNVLSGQSIMLAGAPIRKIEKQKLNLPSLFSHIESNPSNSNVNSIKVLMKKGDKPISKTIEVPEDSSLVMNIKMAKEEQEKESRENKRAVLQLQQNTDGYTLLLPKKSTS